MRFVGFYHYCISDILVFWVHIVTLEDKLLRNFIDTQRINSNSILTTRNRIRTNPHPMCVWIFDVFFQQYFLIFFREIYSRRSFVAMLSCPDLDAGSSGLQLKRFDFRLFEKSKPFLTRLKYKKHQNVLNNLSKFSTLQTIPKLSEPILIGNTVIVEIR